MLGHFLQTILYELGYLECVLDGPKDARTVFLQHMPGQDDMNRLKDVVRRELCNVQEIPTGIPTDTKLPFINKTLRIFKDINTKKMKMLVELLLECVNIPILKEKSPDFLEEILIIHEELLLQLGRFGAGFEFYDDFDD